MNSLPARLAVVPVLLVLGCASTEFKPYEARNNVFEGTGGTKVIVDGMEFWENGDPPRQYKVLGIIDDERRGGILSMSGLRGDVVKKAREAGGDAVVQLTNESKIAGFYSSGSASAYSHGSFTRAYGSSTTVPVRHNISKYAVIEYLD